MKMRVKQHIGMPTEAQIDKLANLAVLLGEPAGRGGAWPDFPYAGVLKQRAQRIGKEPSTLTTDLPNKPGTRVTLGIVKDNAGAFEILTLARRLAVGQISQDPKEVGVLVAGMEAGSARRAAEAQIAALLAAAHAMPTFKSDKPKAKGLATVHLFGLEKKTDFARTLAEAEGNNLARYLTALPPNQLAPRQYLSWVTALAKQHGWQLRFHDLKGLQRKKAGAFLAVAQGSPDPDAGIAHLRYTPAKAGGRGALALVGKGICFDTGGTNLKPARHMHGMHQDMAGSAVALGTLLALTQLKVDFPVDCWLALAQNHIGPRAYKQNDVVAAANGTTIEVVHTDAEGRMVLADTLVLAGRERPALLIDYATLTGSCVQALGTGYSGAFSNRRELLPAIIAAGEASGERVWPFPEARDYDDRLKSEIADIKQCTLDSEADHILAARFLNRFMDPEIPWLHLDLSAASHKDGLAHIPTEVTGFGVRFTLNLLLDHQVLA